MGNWLIYPFTLTVSVTFFALVGLPIAAILARKSRILLCLAPIFGMSILAIAGSWYSLLERPMNRPTLVTTAIVLGLVGLVLLWRDYQRTSSLAHPDRPSSESRARAIKLLGVVLAPWGIGIVVLTFFILPIITMDLLAGGFLTSFTSENNDLGSYILQATNLQQAGFGPTEILKEVAVEEVGSIGDLARFDHTGASALMAANAVFLGMPVWKTATITVLAVSTALLPGSYLLAHQVLRIRLRWSMVAAAVGTLTVFFWYLVVQGFYAQIISISLMLAQLAVVVWAARTQQRWVMVGALPILIAACWYCSPEQELVFVPLLGIGALVGLASKSKGSIQLRSRKFLVLCGTTAIWLGIGLLVSLAVAAPRIKGALGVLATVGKDEIAGWPLTIGGSGAALMGINDIRETSGPSGYVEFMTTLDLVYWILLTVLIAWLIVTAIYRRDRPIALAFVLVIPMALIVAFGGFHWGPNAYQTWKLAMTLSFAILTLIGAMWLAATKSLVAKAVVTGVLLAIVGLSVVLSHRLWDFNLQTAATQRARVINPELVGLLRSPFLQRQEGINIRLDTNFQTMAAPAVYDKQAEMSAGNYFDGALLDGKGFPFACTVMIKDRPRPPELANTQIVKRTKNYIVLGTTECK